MRIRFFVALLSCLALTGTVAVDSARADPSRVTLERPRVDGDVAVLRGRAPAGAKIRTVRKTPAGWRRIAAAHLQTASRLSPDACGKRRRKEDGTLWRCTFVDNFNGTTLDTSKWLVQETSASGVTNGRSCYVDTPSAIKVEGGSLLLSAQLHHDDFTCESPYGDFTTDRTSATVTTKGRFNQTLGRFAFRAKMPTTRVKGAHPALWLYPDGQKYGRWPLSGEIDVAEWYSALPEQVFPSVHYIDGLNDIHTGKRGRFADVSDWHVYELEWTSKTMRFYYDHKLIWEHTWAPLAPLIGTQPFDQPFNVVLTQAWGGLWNAPTEATPHRVTMAVDWVRVWK